MIGQTLGHYRIDSKLGEGGMGVVYRAHDERLERDVALKVILPGRLADEQARVVFRREALSLSRLNHPNVATVFDFDFDPEEGTDFLVMELIEGIDLAERLTEGPLPEAELLGWSVQLVEGLVAAHGRGIVHRDLKPANLCITADGRLKILDFGLACSIEKADDPAHEVPFAGTLAYMAPELLADGEANESTDVYSVGVVLYELATGRAPFGDEDQLKLVRAIERCAPVRPRSWRTDLSTHLEDLILRAMAKRPEQRPTARQLLHDLRALQRPASARLSLYRPRIESLAVLPLANRSGDPGQEFFADGMTEALIADLARLGGLRIVSRTSVMAYRGTGKSLPDIARELDVDAVIEGSIIRSHERVRVTAQLIHAASDSHLWAATYDREMRDVLQLQGELARSIALEIQLKLGDDDSARLVTPRSVDPDAFDAYLRGRHHWNRRTEDGLRRAIDYFDRAIGTDPSYARAYVGLADSYNLLGFYCACRPSDAFPRARDAAEKALAIDPTVFEARISRAYVDHQYDWNAEAAERAYLHAIEAIPSYATGHQFYLQLLLTQGRFEEALARGRSALECDPCSPIVHLANVWPHFFMGHVGRTIAELHNLTAIDPTFVAARFWCGEALGEIGRHREALLELRKADELAGPTPMIEAAIARVLARSGDGVGASKMLAHLVAQSKRRYVSPYFLALVATALGDRDRAFLHLEDAFTERSHWLTFSRVDPRLDALREDPRFDALCTRIGQPFRGIRARPRGARNPPRSAA